MKNNLVAPSKSLGYSEIFLDFLAERDRAQKLYLSSGLKDTASRLDGISYQREEMHRILTRQNKLYQASEKTFENIDKLTDPKAVTLLSGQQAVLFGGPLLVMLKAIALVKAAKLYEKELKRPVVPIFWIAGDDHDFDEANHTYVLNRQVEPVRVAYEARPALDLPTSETQYSNQVALHEAKETLKEALGNTDFTGQLYDLIEHAYTDEDNFVSAFGKFMAGLTADLGLVFFSPGDPEVKRLAIPFFEEVLRRQDELHNEVSATNQLIQENGYHIQVEKKEDATYLFYNLEGRQPILREGSKFRVGDRTFTLDELLSCLHKRPERFSPDVMTRPVLQSFLFPTVSQKGGPSEIAYLAQINPIFELFSLVPPLHRARASATLVEKRYASMMADYGIGFEELLGDIEQVVNRVLEESFPDDLEAKFAGLRQGVREQFERFSDESIKFDPSLRKFAEQVLGKIDYNLGALEGKVFSSHKKKSKDTRERIYRLHRALYTNRGLQERSLNISYFISKYGMGFIKQLYDALDSEEKSHQLINLTEFND